MRRAARARPPRLIRRRRLRRGLGEWQRQAGDDRRRLLESEPASAASCASCGSGVENRPGTVAEIALELGRAGVNIEDMALYPAADMRTGAISIWVAGAEAAARAAEIVSALGHVVSAAG